MKKVSTCTKSKTKKGLLSKCLWAAITAFLVVVIVHNMLNEKEKEEEDTSITSNEKHNVEIYVSDENGNGLNGIHVMLESEGSTYMTGYTNNMRINTENETLSGVNDGNNRIFETLYNVLDQNNDNKINGNDVIVHGNGKTLSVESIDGYKIKLNLAPEKNTKLKITYIGQGNPGYIAFQNVESGEYQLFIEESEKYNENHTKIEVVSDSNYNIELQSKGG